MFLLPLLSFTGPDVFYLVLASRCSTVELISLQNQNQHSGGSSASKTAENVISAHMHIETHTHMLAARAHNSFIIFIIAVTVNYLLTHKVDFKSSTIHRNTPNYPYLYSYSYSYSYPYL